jgi:tetratricopeptide (TPR) repeat protein
MNTDYNKWSKYDVDDELKKVEKTHKKEDFVYDKQVHNKAVSKVFHEASSDNQTSAAVLEARAAVAALKARRGGRRNRRAAKDDDEDEEESAEAKEENDAKIKELAELAEIARQKADSLTAALEERDQAEAELKDGKASIARKRFHEAINQVLRLQASLPEMKDLPAGYEDPAQSEPAGGGHGHGHAHGKKKKKKKKKALPSKDDLIRMSKLLKHDCLTGRSRCEMKLGLYAEATETLKEVLLKDQNNADGWILRGQAYRQMGTDLLAEMHYVRVLELDAENIQAHDDMEEICENIKMDSENSEEQRKTIIKTRLESKTICELLEASVKFRKEGDVVFKEGFFGTAARKYWATIHCLDRVREKAEVSDSAGEPAAMAQTRFACHLNMAAAYLQMQKGPEALKNCRRALGIFPDDVTALFRSAQAHEMKGNFEQALKALMKADSKCTHPTRKQEIAKQTEQCKFRRAQLDRTEIMRMKDELANAREEKEAAELHAREEREQQREAAQE